MLQINAAENFLLNILFYQLNYSFSIQFSFGQDKGV